MSPKKLKQKVNELRAAATLGQAKLHAMQISKPCIFLHFIMKNKKIQDHRKKKKYQNF